MVSFAIDLEFDRQEKWEFVHTFSPLTEISIMQLSLLVLICLTSLEGSPLQLKNPLTNRSAAIQLATKPTTTTTEPPAPEVFEAEEEEEDYEYEYPEIDPISGVRIDYSLGKSVVHGGPDSILIMAFLGTALMAVLILAVVCGCCMQSYCRCPFAAPPRVSDDIQRQLDIATWVRNIETEDAVSIASPPRAKAVSTLKRQKRVSKKSLLTSSPVGDVPVTIVKTPKEAVQAAKEEIEAATKGEKEKKAEKEKGKSEDVKAVDEENNKE